MDILKRIKEKLAYERETLRLSREHTRRIAAELPYPKGYWHMTDAEIENWRRSQG